MNETDLELLRNELLECDRQEREQRELLFTRRWFVRLLAGAIAGAWAWGRAGEAGANTWQCNAGKTPNVCDPNTCTGVPNSCSLGNQCKTGNECTAPLPGNTCGVVNQCPIMNQCGDPNAPGTDGGNTCNILNTCGTGPIVSGVNTCDTNTCTGWNACSPKNVCQTKNKCVTRDRCGPTPVNDTCNGSNKCTPNKSCWVFDSPPSPPGG